MSDDETASTVALDETNALDKIILYALDEAAEKLEQSGELEPFTVILHGDNLHVENHPGEDAAECFNSATAKVQTMAHVLDAYAFAYDGYVSTDEGDRDAIIVERGVPDEEMAVAFALLYEVDESGDGELSFGEGIYDLGPVTSLFAGEELTSDDLEEL